MRHLRETLTVAAIVLSLFACGDGQSNGPDNHAETDLGVIEENPYDYIENEGYLLAGTHANILRSYAIATKDEQGFVPGFNLDDLVTTAGDEASCRHGDFVDPNGRDGIDNQFGNLWSLVEPLVGEATQALIQGAINEGRIILVIELSGVDSLINDDDISIHIFRGRIDPDIGNNGFIAPGQTVYVDREFPVKIVNEASIVNGEVFARFETIDVPIDILETFFVIELDRAQIRFSIDENGHFSGFFGGVVDLNAVFEVLLASNASQEAALVEPIFYNYADMEKGPEGCTHASAAFGFTGTDAFVVHYPTELVDGVSDATREPGND